MAKRRRRGGRKKPHKTENPQKKETVLESPKRNVHYQYEKLLYTNSIRIFSLKPGVSTDPLAIFLEQVMLERLSEVEALSYVWGSSPRRHEILCNEKCLRISDNLGRALRAIRRLDVEVLLWVDAICIDQNNPKERNHQIKHMARIYSEVKNVLVWLGPDPDDIGKESFEFAHHLATDPSTQDTVLQDSWALDRESRCLRELSSFDWFYRMWTMQEIGLASHATFLCGSSRIDWEELFFAYNLYNEIMGPEDQRRNFFKPDQVVLLYRWTASDEDHSFLYLLERSQSRGVTDQRDRIFALTSHPAARIVSTNLSTTTFLIEPDYTKSLNDVYIEVAKCLMEKTGCLDVLSFVRGGEAAVGLPTWAPCWQMPRESRCLLDSKQNFSACGRLNGWFSRCDPTFSDKNVVSILSIRIGMVSWCSTSTKMIDTFAPFPDSRVREAWKVYTEAFRQRSRTELLESFSDIHPRYHAEHEKKLHMDEITAYWKDTWTNKSGADKMAKIVDENTSPMPYASRAWYACVGRVLFFTENGFLGLGPSSMRVGDRIYILQGGKVPYVLRTQDSGASSLVGECYVHGIMMGEAVADENSGCETVELI
jgi:hypothetical protein